MAGESVSALYGLFLDGLRKSPGGTAFRVGDDSATYERLHELALSWGGALLRTPSPRPTAVGVLAGKGTVCYAGILAGLAAGVTVVPLRPDFPAARTRQMIEAARVSTLIVDERGGEVAATLRAEGLEVHVLAVGASRALPEPRPVRADDIAYVLFTSGSTGVPKGVPITHGNTGHYFRFLAGRYDFTCDDVFSQTFDLTFDCAMFDLFCAWGAGATSVAVPPAAYRDLPSFLAEQGVTVWFSTPSAIWTVRRTGGLRAAAMPHLRWSFFAGEALRCADAADWQRAAPASVVENLYGPTELTVTIAGHRWCQEISPGLGVNGLSPIGSVNPGHDHLLIEDGRLADTEGELWITGPQLTPGYLDPDHDKGRFVERDDRVWYNTGDRVRRAVNGELVYLGRADSQVQVQGWRVEPAEIDHAVRGCEGVENAVTVSTTAGNATELVVFYTGRPTSISRFAAQLRRTLPTGLIPRHYRHLDELPLNPNGKVDRAGLRDRAAELVAGTTVAPDDL
ncbi:AMP-binding protein [Nonomuraea sp. NPDC049607]|uniref:AMP-binding protein n=1 Tax=Nonomuraea sp. NPDC049607 TaxID=3154732 RepID=UPI003429FD33